MCFLGPDARSLALFYIFGFVWWIAVLCGAAQAESCGAWHEGEAHVDPAGGRGGGDRSG